MLFDGRIDIIEDELRSLDERLLNMLLLDKSSLKNILWATDNYRPYGDGYETDSEITPERITGEYSGLIRPRISKSLEDQAARTREKAEVFTPCWVCNAQNNLVDAQWFGRADIFNTESEKSWKTKTEKIVFPDAGSKRWQRYVDLKRLEITCGEAPYLVSRYDTATGEMIPIPDRIGLLDRKLRVVEENTDGETEWFKWALRAFQSVYGYEYQGDNLLLARENLLATFGEYYLWKFNSSPSVKMLLKIANVISWNLWQMDGLKYVVPNSCHEVQEMQMNLLGFSESAGPCPGCKDNDPSLHNGIYCRIFDWRAKTSLRFVDLVKGTVR